MILTLPSTYHLLSTIPRRFLGKNLPSILCSKVERDTDRGRAGHVDGNSRDSRFQHNLQAVPRVRLIREAR